MRTRCNPGDRCVVVADVPGAECNIGATLTVTERIPLVVPPAWAFKDASRPLKMIGATVHEDGTSTRLRGRDNWTTATGGDLDADIVSGFFDHHLVPIRDLPAAQREQLEVAMESAA